MRLNMLRVMISPLPAKTSGFPPLLEVIYAAVLEIYADYTPNGYVFAHCLLLPEQARIFRGQSCLS